MFVFKLPEQKDYPSHIYYNTEVYRIIFKKNFKCFGETDPEDKTITIKDGMAPRAILATFLHELFHVIELERPLKLRHKIVYKLEKAMLELLIDNFFATPSVKSK